jgi:putative N6-adenine-specific DNA methylase
MADSNENKEEKKGGDIFKRLNIRKREEGDPKPEKKEFNERDKGADSENDSRPEKRVFKPRKREDNSSSEKRDFKPRNKGDEYRTPKHIYKPRRRDDGLNEEEVFDENVFRSREDKDKIKTKPLIEKKGKKLPPGKFYLVATCMQNLEPELEQELIEIGAEEIDVQKRAIRFVADLELLYKANIWLRTAIKVLKPLFHFKAESTDELYEGAMEIAWESVFSKDKTFSIDFSVHSENFTHSQFAALRLKDAIVDRFRKQGIDRPNVAREQPDVRIHLHINGNQVNLSMDSSGDPLFKRGYRREMHFAPINECLAAGLILKTGWRGEVDLLDPMTGTATIAIEAAMIACNIPANFGRTFFAFENWEDYDQALLSKVLRDAQGQFRPLKCDIYAREIQSNNIRSSRVNINAANMRKSIILEQEDFFKAPKPSEKGIIIMNPPYGERLEVQEGLPDFFSKIGSTLKHEYSGWSAWIISSDLESFHNIALKPIKKIPMLNGKLECQFRGYELFDGTLKEKKGAS